MNAPCFRLVLLFVLIPPVFSVAGDAPVVPAEERSPLSAMDEAAREEHLAKLRPGLAVGRGGQITEEQFETALWLIRQPGLSKPDIGRALEVLRHGNRHQRRRVDEVRKDWERLSFMNVAWNVLIRSAHHSPEPLLSEYVFSNPPREDLESLAEVVTHGNLALLRRDSVFTILHIFVGQMQPHFTREVEWLRRQNYLKQAVELWLLLSRRPPWDGVKTKPTAVYVEFLDQLLGDRGRGIPPTEREDLIRRLLEVQPRAFHEVLLDAETAPLWGRVIGNTLLDAAIRGDADTWGERMSEAFSWLSAWDSLAYPMLTFLPDDVLMRGMTSGAPEEIFALSEKILRDILRKFPGDERLLLALARLYALEERLDDLLALTPVLLRHPNLDEEFLRRHLEQVTPLLGTEASRERLGEIFTEARLRPSTHEMFLLVVWQALHMGWDDLLEAYLQFAHENNMLYAECWRRIVPIEQAYLRGDWEEMLRRLPDVLADEPPRPHGAPNAWSWGGLGGRIVEAALRVHPLEEAYAFLHEAQRSDTRQTPLQGGISASMANQGFPRPRPGEDPLPLPAHLDAATLLSRMDMAEPLPAPLENLTPLMELERNTDELREASEDRRAVLLKRFYLLRRLPYIPKEMYLDEEEIAKTHAESLHRDYGKVLNDLLNKNRVLWASDLFPWPDPFEPNR
ncbi:MAG: hypothetical protein JJU29_21630 [Verrucomicrobia bacterium]|nr:hypothetical protein [Verrucomicrobiota bacterium]